MSIYRDYTRKIRTLAIALIALGFMTNASAAIYYVKASAPNGGSGSSWSSAYNKLSSALNAAKLSSVPSQIWIAAGTYKPTTICGNATATFQIPSNVAIYGGFNGTETSVNKRNRDTNPTVLSGDICNLGHPTTVQTNKTNYSWHVLTANAVTGVTMDSLIVMDGYASGPDSGTLDPALMDPPQFVIKKLDQADDAGGGLLVRNASKINLNNLIFKYNDSDATGATVGGNPLLGSPAIASGGGAIAAVEEDTLVTVSNSLFQNNNALVLGGNGGALNALVEASFNVINCTFLNNTAFRNGGAIHGKDSGTITVLLSNFKNNIVTGAALGDESGGALGIIDTNLTVSGSYFEANVAGVLAGGGGAIFFHTPFDDGTPYKMTVNNSVFKNNQAFASGGGAINVFGVQPAAGASANIDNCLFVGNVAGVGGAVHNSSLPTTISDSLFIGNQAWIQGGAVYDSNVLNVIVSPGPIVRPALAISDDTFVNNSIIGFPKNTVHCSFPVTVFPCTFTPTDFFNLVANAFGPFFGGPPSNVTVINQGGGAIGAGFSATVNISGALFLFNSANSSPNDDGGAILAGGTLGALLNTNPPGQGMNKAIVNFTNSIFTGNSAALGHKNAVIEDLGTPCGGVLLNNATNCLSQ
jgi:predicted outer membrane repeat protein